jgi:hypothetical protein
MIPVARTARLPTFVTPLLVGMSCGLHPTLRLWRLAREAVALDSYASVAALRETGSGAADEVALWLPCRDVHMVTRYERRLLK